jgi:hypothetical protein
LPHSDFDHLEVGFGAPGCCQMAILITRLAAVFLAADESG